MELLKADPFQVMLFSEKYQRDLIHTISMIRYSVKRRLIIFNVFCMEDEPSYPTKCECDSMTWIRLINSSLKE